MPSLPPPRPTTTTVRSSSAPGAPLFFAVMVLLLIALVFYSLRNPPEPQAEEKGWWAELQAKIEGLFAASPSANQQPGAASEATPGDVPTESAPLQPPPPPPPPPPAPLDASPEDMMDLAVKCVDQLRGFAENVRIAAIDVGPRNVDVVQESAGKRNIFVRMGCEVTGTNYNIYEAGRMQFPAIAGDPARLPASLIELDKLDRNWFGDRIAAAQKATHSAANIARLEASWIKDRGVVTRVRFADDDKAVLLDKNLKTLSATSAFPLVERSSRIPGENPPLGFRDQGETIWSSGVGDSVQQMGDKFAAGQRFYSLEFIGRHARAHVPGNGKKVDLLTVDEYGELQPKEDSSRAATDCEKPFTLADARTALDREIRTREMTPAQFEELEFESAKLDCLKKVDQPNWHFE